MIYVNRQKVLIIKKRRPSLRNFAPQNFSRYMQATKNILDTQPCIDIKGARLHNLNNVDVQIPHNQLTVVTGVSGSGKSSLCIDTLYAEGQRRYVESLSAYARQFLMRMNKPEVDYMHGLRPAIAIEQRTVSKAGRSTVGSLTEVYDYLRILYARIGRTISPVSGKEVKKQQTSDVVEYLKTLAEGEKAYLLCPVDFSESFEETVQLFQQMGYTRVLQEANEIRLDALTLEEHGQAAMQLVIDRFKTKTTYDTDTINRLAESIEQAFHIGHGICTVFTPSTTHTFSNQFELDGILFEEPIEHLFNFNNPYGACKRCEGFGTVVDVDDKLVVPNTSLSIFENAIAPWRGEKMKEWKDKLIQVAQQIDFPIHKPYNELTEQQLETLWKGNKHFEGLDAFFEELEQMSYKIQYRVLLSRYRGKTSCKECKGSRLRKEVQYVHIGDKHIGQLLTMPVVDLVQYVEQVDFNEYEQEIADRIIVEVKQRLGVMNKIGLGYLTLIRSANTLSGGETQRIHLTRMLGSNLTSSLYVLDEPSIGLHSHDTMRLIETLKELRNLGNTVVVVEHDEDMIKEADYLIDLGPRAGVHGGDLMFSGPPAAIGEAPDSLTNQYLLGTEFIAIPETIRTGKQFIHLKGVRENNLKNIDVQLPLQAFSVISGVSGSGKTTLIKKVLYTALRHELEEFPASTCAFDSLEGDITALHSIELIDQNPLGRSSRSNPVTYVKAYDSIRELFTKQQQSKILGLMPKDFSFNVEGGRCETCKGDGNVTIEMQFLADIQLTCEACNGQRFKQHVLDVQYKNKNIHEVLSMTIEESITFFAERKDIVSKLAPLVEVGLGYVTLGQSSSTLSGGEAQRLKLASFLTNATTTNKKLYIFDEPTTGLHFDDVKKLLIALQSLVELGHTVIVIEHHLDVLKCADWIVDLGPTGGNGGGELLYQGPVKGLLAIDRSVTGQYLKDKFR